MSSFLVFGSHPQLSLNEAQAVFPEALFETCGTSAFSRTELDPTACVERLGGTVKAGRILLELSSTQNLTEALVELIRTHPRARKIVFSLTIFGNNSRFQRLPIELKRALQEEGTPARWFADTEGLVSPAAVKKAGLLEDGYDICVFVQEEKISLGFTEAVQDPDAWSLRDMGRPARDAKNGMLPPKLARILVNLAGKNTDRTLLDPFCGSGTILMEAALMGYKEITGSDLDPIQVKDSERNLTWLAQEGLITPEQREKMRLVVSAAAYAHTRISAPIDAIVTEGYLGTPLTGSESLATLTKEAATITQIWTEALPTFANLQPSGGILVGVWPILTSRAGEVRVDALQAAEAAGYALTGPADLVYARPEQFVQRRIVRLQKQ